MATDNWQITALDIAIGQKIKEVRLKAGKKQGELAFLLNISIQQICKYESGNDRIPAAYLCIIAKHLQVPIETFFLNAERIIKGCEEK